MQTDTVIASFDQGNEFPLPSKITLHQYVISHSTPLQTRLTRVHLAPNSRALYYSLPIPSLFFAETIEEFSYLSLISERSCMAGEDDPKTRINGDPGKGYGLSEKMMSGAIVILFVVVIFMIAVHLYGRWYVLRMRRRQLERRRERLVSRSHILMYIDSLASVNRGLERAVLNSLPVFLYSPKAGQPPMECAVCLSEFEEKDMVRLLPDCNHSFHIDCIDFWFRAHSTCPICRSPVEMVDRIIKPVWKTTGAEPGSSSGSRICDACHQEEGNGDGSESLSEGRRRGLELLEVRVNMPPRRAELENELRQSSLGSRVVSVRGILSVGRRSPGVAVPTMSHEAGTSLVATELEQESGHQVRAGTSA